MSTAAFLSGCASSAPTLSVVSTPTTALLTAAEGEEFRCPAVPVLGADTSYEGIESLGLRLRAAYDNCKGLDDRLIAIATKPPQP